MTGFKRWAAILLPFVILARVVLLMFQLRDEHREREHRYDPPSWPATPGEELHFRTDWPHVAAWVQADSHPQLLVPLLERDFLPVEPDSGCVLDLWAVLHHGGTMTLRPQLKSGTWPVEWSGRRTVPTRAELTGPPQAETELRVLDAADCGGSARLELTDYQLHVLVAALSDAPFPDPPDPPPLVRPIHIHVPGPPPDLPGGKP